MRGHVHPTNPVASGGRGGIVRMHRENFSVYDGGEAELIGHAADIRRAGGAIFRDDGHTDVDELAMRLEWIR